jgi:hypothetical protein
VVPSNGHPYRNLGMDTRDLGVAGRALLAVISDWMGKHSVLHWARPCLAAADPAWYEPQFAAEQIRSDVAEQRNGIIQKRVALVAQ